MRCAEVRELLPAFVREDHADEDIRQHLASCPECSAEFSRYVALAGSLSAMRDVSVDVPPDLSQRLFAIPSESSRVVVLKEHVARNRSAYLGGAAAALAGVGVAAWRIRRHATA
jgi:anti-sigma factor RsiW